MDNKLCWSTLTTQWQRKRSTFGWPPNRHRSLPYSTERPSHPRHRSYTNMSERESAGASDSVFFYVLFVHPLCAWILAPNRLRKDRATVSAIVLMAIIAFGKMVGNGDKRVAGPVHQVQGHFFLLSAINCRIQGFPPAVDTRMEAIRRASCRYWEYRPCPTALEDNSNNSHDAEQ